MSTKNPETDEHKVPCTCPPVNAFYQGGRELEAAVAQSMKCLRHNPRLRVQNPQESK